MSQKPRKRKLSQGQQPGNKTSASSLVDRAIGLQNAGDAEQAIPLYKRALASQPNNLDALMNLAHALRGAGKVSDATKFYKRAAKVGGGNWQVLQDAGGALAELALWPDAQELLESAIKLAPSAALPLTTLGFLHLENGRLEEAAPMLEKAVALDPALPDAWFNLSRTLYEQGKLEDAIASMNGAYTVAPDSLWYRFWLAVMRDQAGDPTDLGYFENLARQSGTYRGALESWKYIKDHSGRVKLFTGSRPTLMHGLAHSELDGLVLEFGVRFGRTLRWLAEQEQRLVHGFDSFDGLPDSWHVQPAGTYTAHGEKPQQMPDNVRVHVGLFQDTLPTFAGSTTEPVRFVNVDCDLYSSTKVIFEHLGDRIQPGTVLVFDEYLINDNWRLDEYKAFQELVVERKLSYEYLAFSLFEGQAAVRITAAGA